MICSNLYCSTTFDLAEDFTKETKTIQRLYDLCPRCAAAFDMGQVSACQLFVVLLLGCAVVGSLTFAFVRN